jgi:Brp/Blh family beta-carotene 15,15'-monooxygenase
MTFFSFVINFEVQIFILVTLIITLGIPHGAYDYQVAKRIGLANSRYKVIAFYIVYIGLVFFSLYTWYAFPFFSLLVFLLLSSWHFGSDWAISRGDTLVPILIGICILIFPSMIHQHQVTKVFSYLVLYENAHTLVIVMRQLAFILLPVGIFFCYHFLRNEGMVKCFELLSIFLSSIFLPPLVFLIFYFCLFHSITHLNFLYGWLKFNNFKAFFINGLPLSLISILFLSVVYLIFYNSNFSQDILKSVIILVAVITIPHMILIEYARLIKTNLRDTYRDMLNLKTRSTYIDML